METEVFYQEEVTDLIHDVEKLDEWKKMVEDMGLEGQTKLANPEKSPVPFMVLNQFQTRILQAICPESREVSKFEREPIPLPVLSAIALSRAEGYFTKIEIWADNESPDPVAVGIRDDHKYLIARWGAEKLSWEKLEKKAIARVAKKAKDKATEGLAFCKAVLEDQSDIANKLLKGESVYLWF